MTVLVFGVDDFPYANAPRAKGTKAVSGTQTTGDVAEWLEQKYHVMLHFYELHQKEIVADLEESWKGAIVSLVLGGPAHLDVSAEATDKIKQRFSDMLDQRELDRLGYPGIPTGAAMRGVNHSMSHPYARRAARSSFIDTDTYRRSFMAWVEQTT